MKRRRYHPILFQIEPGGPFHLNVLDEHEAIIVTPCGIESDTGYCSGERRLIPSIEKCRVCMPREAAS